MTDWPRALVGPVRCMARPSRPLEEGQAVREAANLLRMEGKLRSSRALAVEIATRVVSELLNEIEGDALDKALSLVGRTVLQSPISQLATCEKIDTLAEFLKLRIELIVARSGRYLSPFEQGAEQKRITKALRLLLAGRYDRHLRSGLGS